MNNFTGYLKALLIATLIWIGVYVGTVGLLSAGFALSVILLALAMIALLVGAVMAVSLLERAEDVWLRLALVLLISVGTVAFLRAMEKLTWIKGI